MAYIIFHPSFDPEDTSQDENGVFPYSPLSFQVQPKARAFRVVEQGALLAQFRIRGIPQRCYPVVSTVPDPLIIVCNLVYALQSNQRTGRLDGMGILLPTAR